MNMTEIIDTLGGILIVGIPTVLFILLIKLLPSKGAIGEKRVAHILKKLPPNLIDKARNCKLSCGLYLFVQFWQQTHFIARFVQFHTPSKSGKCEI